MEAACLREVEELHRLFQDWFNGRARQEDFARIEEALAEDFHLVRAEGGVQQRAQVLADLRANYGVSFATGLPIRIRIRELALRWEQAGAALVTYQEWQQVSGTDRGRLSTALLARRPDRPERLHWLHVHETWLPTP